METWEAFKAGASARGNADDAGDDEDDDFWGDDDDQTPEEKAAAAKELEEAKAKAMAKLAKKEANQRSLCNLEIKPWEAEQDLNALFKSVARRGRNFRRVAARCGSRPRRGVPRG